MDRGQLLQHTKRHGFHRTGLVYLFRVLRRLVDFDVMRVYVADGSPTKSPEVPGYVTRCITDAEYEVGIKAFEGDHQRMSAFERGDRCFANFHGDDMVGYTFYSLCSTVVRTGVEFQFPDTLIFAYAGFTEPTHRGRRLALARSNTRKRVDQKAGIERRIIWYESVDNYGARASLRMGRGVLVGYLGYAKFGHRFLCFASRWCKRTEVSLVQTSSAPW